MIQIARLPLPEPLPGRLLKLTGEIHAIEPAERSAHARRLWGRKTVREPLGGVLREMALGRECCMYCGESQAVGIDHYEPLKRNPLRTFDWLNHLLACTQCNSTHKGARFPIDHKGDPLLIDPTAEDPFEHLQLTLALGIYTELTAKGKATIDICGLNRRGLPRGRQQSRRVVEMCVREWAAAAGRGDAAAQEEAALTVREQPFADVCQSMLRLAESPGATQLFRGRDDILEILREPALRAALLI